MAENIKIRIGNRIRELRKDKGISQEKLAGLAEIDRTYMTSVENGRRNIAVVNLEKIVNALGVDLKEFFNSNDFSK
ncbi:MAG: XRE family transcriptional regulator [Candidatus Moranbacteria bacterium]|nr:XRE family transcriptional regulator [Candidatus Moranbacteria bacterium]